MTIREYQRLAQITDTVVNNKRSYLNLGIRGEAGEVCDKIKKMIRDNRWIPGTEIDDEIRRRGILLELGDVMWYTVIYAYYECRPVSCQMCFDEKTELNDVETYEDKHDLADMAIDLYECMASAHINTWEIVVCIATMAHMLGTDLENVCRMNIDKLRSRLERGMIGGSGDER